MNRTHLLAPSHVIPVSLALVAAIAGCSKNGPSTAAPVAPAPVAAEKLRDGEYAKLAALVGEWQGTGTLTAGGNDMTVTSKFHCAVAKGGVAVSCVHEADIAGMGPMIENALFGLDPATGKLHWYNVNTMGETHDHTGSWTGDKQLDWRFEGTQDGKSMVESILMRVSETSMTFRSEMTIAGQQASLFVGTMTKS